MFPRYLQLLLVGVWSVSTAHSFGQPRGQRAFAAHGRRTGSLYSAAVEEEEEDSEKAEERIQFTADMTFTTDPLGDAKVGEVAEFLKKQECRELLLSAGGIRAVEEIAATPELQERWQGACAFYESEPLPDSCDQFLSTDTIIPFPGLVLTNTVVNGIKELTDDKGFPRLAFVLVAEKRSVTGSKPLVWIFNQLTRSGKDSNDAQYSPPQGHALTYASIAEKDGAFSFNIAVQFRIIITFPAVLVRILPTSKAKMEEKGSASVSKMISKDVDAASISLRDAFIKWHSDPVSV